ncbi:hypothetical protein ACJZ2D_015914 [Fusarium nematophilum]
MRLYYIGVKLPPPSSQFNQLTAPYPDRPQSGQPSRRAGQRKGALIILSFHQKQVWPADLESGLPLTSANSYSEVLTLFSKTVAERAHPGQRQDVKEQDYTSHALRRSEGVCGVTPAALQDVSYLPRTIMGILQTNPEFSVDEFLSRHPRSVWATGEPALAFPELRDYLSRYQDPQQADSTLKIQRELDETKIVLHKTIESVLQRGEKIDDLITKSDDLSAQSKMFFEQAKKQNSCCLIL